MTAVTGPGEQGFEGQAPTGPLDTRIDLDLGDDHTLQFWSWYGEPKGQRSGAIVTHKKPDGTWCQGSISFDVPASRERASGRPSWTVHSWEPLTLAPSLVCHCGDHGFIREGRWVRA